MPDPAIEAAQRAWDERYRSTPDKSHWIFENSLADDGIAKGFVSAAREMARPIREHIENIPAGLDATDLYDELDFIYRRLLGGHCEECRDD